MIEIFIIIFLCLWLLLSVYILRSMFFSTPYYPSRIKSIDKFYKESKILKNYKGKKFVDVGSGDGRVVFWADRNGFKAYGVELNPFLTLISKFINIFRKTNSKFINDNFYKHDFSDYDVIFLYIYKEHMHKLLENLKQNTKKDAIIVSNTFTFTGLKPLEEIGRFRVYKVS